jgi:hypothetical protein
MAYGSYGPHEWELVRKWILTAHVAGFMVFINVLANSGDQVAGMTQQSAIIGADIVVLDEPISLFPSYMTQAQLQSVINTGRAANPNLQYLITEWGPTYIRRAYEWTTAYPYVRVAEDNYNDKSMIDLNIQLGAQYGKAPATWLIFAKGSQDYDCYRNLDNWIAYGQQRGISAFFWFIDPAGTWTANWSSVVAFDPRACL